MSDRLSAYALTRGLSELRRILRDTAGYTMAGALVPFAAEHRRSAERALEEVCRKAELWETAVAMHHATRAGVEIPLTAAQRDRLIDGLVFGVKALERPRSDVEVPLCGRVA